MNLTAHLQTEGVVERFAHADAIEGHLSKVLLDPLTEFFGSSGKNIRPRLVGIGCALAGSKTSSVDLHKRDLAESIVEMIHAGSLIVDDIQDGSLVRRTKPTLHVKHGLPVALNAGNWLYFHALKLVYSLDLPPERTSSLVQDLITLMGEAHFGQGIDVGTKIDEVPQSLVKSTCLASMELKTGALLSIALRLGLALGENSRHQSELLTLGRQLGIALQMFDDIGNFTAPRENPAKKRHEDLYNRRPTWVWAVASEYSPEVFQAFQVAVSDLPNEERLVSWSRAHDFENRLRKGPRELLASLGRSWHERWSEDYPEAVVQFDELKTILETSYETKK